MNQNVTSLLGLIETAYQSEINIIIEKQLKSILEENDKPIYQDNITIDRIINYRTNKNINICVILKKDNKHYQSYELKLSGANLTYQDDLHRQSGVTLHNPFNNIHINLINNDNAHVDISLHHAYITLGKLNIIYDLLKQEVVDVKPDVISTDECLRILKDIIMTDVNDEIIYADQEHELISNKKVLDEHSKEEPVRYKLNYHHSHVHQYETGKAQVDLGAATIIYDSINKRIDKIIPDVVSEESCLAEMINKSIIKIRHCQANDENNNQEYQRRRVR